MTALASVDYFSDPAVAQNPYEYLDYRRSRNPAFREPHHGVAAVTGYREVIEVYRDPDTYWSCISVGGPFPPLPFTPVGDDIGAQIEEHRHQLLMLEHIVTMDVPNYARTRTFLNWLLTPAQRHGYQGMTIPMPVQGIRHLPAKYLGRRPGTELNDFRRHPSGPAGTNAWPSRSPCAKGMRQPDVESGHIGRPNLNQA